ncbi:FAD-binding oxidoreductase [Halomonas sp. McH1-25]|uniref:NAD(P)/FAD-dependent oxidoreductase n=1 Tax=unclassified Halomonas TaxID=2609666 RepID=UPI001EF6E356|nr:FAD-binding oxidoreductase [Halomonas sp. McH1-25]MCP1344582.1 FAD-binding oxidoreductase [Halomonas sp. FL8]MCP1362596.1 FAD-binding oxidoreductase [Halomonas sp. BBD45]MCP1363976.1 FAD-binding oxidoreductase [Halomonas sp. BBD48]
MTTRVVIVGAGFHGCSAAVHLSSQGHQVTVIDKAYAGRHASGVNAGGVRRLGRHPAEIPLATAAWQRWQRMTDLVGDDCGFRPVGQIKVAENDADMQLLADRETQIRSLGFDHEYLIDREELRRRIPSVASHCPGGLACDGDGYANPYRTVTAWRRRAQQHGAIFHEGIEVTNLDSHKGGWEVTASGQRFQADIVVNCAGAWAGTLCERLGEPVPLTAEAPMLMITERLSPFLQPVVGATSRPLSFKQFENGTVLIGGGVRGAVDFQRDLAETRLDGLAENANTVVSLFPFMAQARIVRTWAGVEAVMPDQIPVLSRSHTHDNVIHVFGFSAHGYQLGAITGEIVADLVNQAEPSLPITPFSITRFQDA